jgi:CHASE1-domain containing sensor protein
MSEPTSLRPIAAEPADGVCPARRGTLTRLLPVLAVLLIGGATSLGAYLVTRDWQARDLAKEFGIEAQAHADQIADQFRHFITQMQAVGRFFAASQEVTDDEFTAFARASVIQDQLARALAWAPRVSDAERPGFEAQARAAGRRDFAIRDGIGTTSEPAAPRPEYFPLYLLEPRTDREPLLGLDLGAEPRRRADLDQARDLGQPRAMLPLDLGLEVADQPALLVALPHYRNGAPVGTPEERHHSLQGFVLGTIAIANLVRTAREQMPHQDCDLRLRDMDGPGTAAADLDPGAVEQGPLQFQAALDVAGHRLALSIRPTADYLARHSNRWAAVMLAMGLLVTGMLTSLVALLQRRRLAVEALVRQRTRELTAALDQGRASELRLCQAQELGDLGSFVYEIATDHWTSSQIGRAHV